MNQQQYELITKMCERPGMYVGEANFKMLCAFLDGMHFVNKSLIGFREWLVVKADDADNLGWSGVVRLLAHREGITEDEPRIKYLGSLIHEFHEFASSTRHNTLLMVHLRYYHWKSSKSWFNPKSPHYIDPEEFQNPE